MTTFSNQQSYRNEYPKANYAVFLCSIMFIGLLLVSAIPVIAQHTQHQSPAMDSQSELSDLEALYWQRLHDSRQHFVQADVDFMSDMIVHHAQALIMSRMSPDNGASAAVRRLSARIINAQQDEIALMQQWLRDREQAVPIVHFDGIDMHVRMEMSGASNGHDGHVEHEQHDVNRHHEEENQHNSHRHEQSNAPKDAHADHHGHENHANHAAGHTTHSANENGEHDGHDGDSNHRDAHADHHGHNHEDMVGMLSQAQMEELASARGTEFDRLFLTYMIEHHEGAVYMVNELFLADGAGTDLDSYRLAVDIYAEQVTEIAMMRGMLDRKGFHVPEPLPELQEQQERLRNPSAATSHDHHQNSHNHH